MEPQRLMSEQDGDELLPLKDAAERIGTTIPRLRRALARPEFASHVQTITRSTRTGTRTTQTVPVSVLVLVQEALDNPVFPSLEAVSDKEKSRTETNKNENEVDKPVPVLVPVPLDEFVALKEAAAVLATLTEDLARERVERRQEKEAAADALKREQEAHHEARVLHQNTQVQLEELRRRAAELEAMNGKMIAALPVPEATDADRETGQETAVSDTHTGGSGEGDKVAARAWWRFWNR